MIKHDIEQNHGQPKALIRTNAGLYWNGMMQMEEASSKNKTPENPAEHLDSEECTGVSNASSQTGWSKGVRRKHRRISGGTGVGDGSGPWRVEDPTLLGAPLLGSVPLRVFVFGGGGVFGEEGWGGGLGVWVRANSKRETN